MVGRLLTFGSVVLVCITILAVGHMWTGRYPFQPAPAPKAPAKELTTEEAVDEEKLKYLTAIIVHSFGRTSDEKPKLLAGIAARNLSEPDGLNKSYKAIFDGSLESIPPGSERKTLYFRSIGYIMNEVSEAEWKSAEDVARKILRDKNNALKASLPESERCVTTFVRSDKADPAKKEDRKTIDAAKKVYTMPDGAFFVCLPFPKKE